jgi:hypothetical protein
MADERPIGGGDLLISGCRGASPVRNLGARRANEEAGIGLVLFPGDGDVTSPDVSWSSTGFNTFRRWLAQVEGFALAGMDGFGGDRPWNSVTTTLAPLLHHPDDAGPDLAPADCGAMLPRLEEIIAQQHEEGDPALQRHLDDARRLAGVMRYCVSAQVDLVFG